MDFFVECDSGDMIRIVGKKGRSEVLIDNRAPVKGPIDSCRAADLLQRDALDFVLTIDIDTRCGV